uniref:Uncharacterized protein n=1 Tax=Anguilla anguilla TaxID=7936 RepID=A0A0E9PSS7_ANGAN
MVMLVNFSLSEYLCYTISCVVKMEKVIWSCRLVSS